MKTAKKRIIRIWSYNVNIKLDTMLSTSDKKVLKKMGITIYNHGDMSRIEVCMVSNVDNNSVIHNLSTDLIKEAQTHTTGVVLPGDNGVLPSILTLSSWVVKNLATQMFLHVTPANIDDVKTVLENSFKLLNQQVPEDLGLYDYEEENGSLSIIGEETDLELMHIQDPAFRLMTRQHISHTRGVTMTVEMFDDMKKLINQGLRLSSVEINDISHALNMDTFFVAIGINIDPINDDIREREIDRISAIRARHKFKAPKMYDFLRHVEESIHHCNPNEVKVVAQLLGPAVGVTIFTARYTASMNYCAKYKKATANRGNPIIADFDGDVLPLTVPVYHITDDFKGDTLQLIPLNGCVAPHDIKLKPVHRHGKCLIPDVLQNIHNNDKLYKAKELSDLQKILFQSPAGRFIAHHTKEVQWRAMKWLVGYTLRESAGDMRKYIHEFTISLRDDPQFIIRPNQMSDSPLVEHLPDLIQLHIEMLYARMWNTEKLKNWDGKLDK